MENSNGSLQSTFGFWYRSTGWDCATRQESIVWCCCHLQVAAQPGELGDEVVDAYVSLMDLDSSQVGRSGMGRLAVLLCCLCLVWRCFLSNCFRFCIHGIALCTLAYATSCSFHGSLGQG